MSDLNSNSNSITVPDLNSNPLTPNINMASKIPLTAIVDSFSSHSAVREKLTYAAVAKTSVDQRKNTMSDGGRNKATQLRSRQSARILARIPIPSITTSKPTYAAAVTATVPSTASRTCSKSTKSIDAEHLEKPPKTQNQPNLIDMSDFNSNPPSPKINAPCQNALAAIVPPFSNHSTVGEKLTPAVAKTPVTQLPTRRSARILARIQTPLINSSKPTYAAAVAATVPLTGSPNQRSRPSISRSSSLSDLPSSNLSSLDDNTNSIQPSPLHQTKKKKRKRSCYSKQNIHQKQKSNARLNKRRKSQREKNCSSSFTDAPPPSGFRIIQKKVTFIDLFPAITQDLRDRLSERKHLKEEYKLDPKNLEKPPNTQIIARTPDSEENSLALETVKKTFRSLNSGYHKIYDERTKQVVAMVEFIKLDQLTESQLDNLNFLCLFLHRCKEFISPVGSKTRKCGGIMWAVGWRKGYEGLEILGRYRNQKAIDANPLRFSNLMGDSARAGEVVWDLFHGFGNVAVKKNQAYMDQYGIPSFADTNFPKVDGDKTPFGFASNLVFSSHGFYNHHHKDDGDASELPLAFAMIIPTSKVTGMIATKADGYDVENGQFIFRDIQIALDFKPDTICRMIFRAQEYVHGTLYPNEPSDFTKLGLVLQVATKASNVCKNYINGKYDDDSDKYFGGVDELVGN
ncbi:hypothetical protein PGTUg99_031322 [Puccinia graminis f. sp. tritici]|uniref:Tet-like 2OG-Fe(II) oxygenase domain-containing protein n=1 Tax=Puccinia graminis f. sp. tritici TaxID=56615 RepID=A0A5B0PIT6_PUCGR|nr:hypothetical protein PGTUg99_031322 [Puccinia graminis f. sp. tritici]